MRLGFAFFQQRQFINECPCGKHHWLKDWTEYQHWRMYITTVESQNKPHFFTRVLTKESAKMFQRKSTLEENQLHIEICELVSTHFGVHSMNSKHTMHIWLVACQIRCSLPLLTVFRCLFQRNSLNVAKNVVCLIAMRYALYVSI